MLSKRLPPRSRSKNALHCLMSRRANPGRIWRKPLKVRRDDLQKSDTLGPSDTKTRIPGPEFVHGDEMDRAAGSRCPFPLPCLALPRIHIAAFAVKWSFMPLPAGDRLDDLWLSPQNGVFPDAQKFEHSYHLPRGLFISRLILWDELQVSRGHSRRH
jgi:hypothetical protein